MNSHDFGRATMPDLVSNGGRTRLVFSPSNSQNAPLGVQVYEFPAGHPEQAQHLLSITGPWRGDPSLSPNGQYVGYFHAGDRGRVVEIASGRVVLDLPVLKGNHAIRLRNGSAVYQTAEGIFEAPFDGFPPTRLGDYSATGIAYLVFDGYVTWDANLVAHKPLIAPAFAGELAVGLQADSGLLVRLGGHTGYLYRGEQWNDPAACEEAAGTYAFAVWQPSVTLRVIAGLTAADVAAMPSYSPTPHVPDPVPDPEPPMPDNLESLVRDVWAKYGGAPGGGNPLRGVILNEVAWRANHGTSGPWGMSRKEGGTFVLQPKTGEKIAHDILQHGVTEPDGTAMMFDVFNDAGVTWGEAEQHMDPQRVRVSPVQPEDVTDPDEPDDPDVPPQPSLEPRVAALEQLVTALKADLATATARIAEMEHHTHAPVPAPLPKLKIVADNSASPVSTSRTWSHSHELRLRIEQE